MLVSCEADTDSIQNKKKSDQNLKVNLTFKFNFIYEASISTLLGFGYLCFRYYLNFSNANQLLWVVRKREKKHLVKHYSGPIYFTGNNSPR